LAVTADLEFNMFLTAKLNLISGMIIGAALVAAVKQQCKHRQNQQQHSTPNDPPQD